MAAGSLMVICPAAHRVKVSTQPNMSLQAVLQQACTKRGLDPAQHRLQHRGRPLDLSSSIRFSGLPNLATVELTELTEEERAGPGLSQEVSLCLQTPTGARLVAAFPPSASLGAVMEHWAGQVGEPGPGEQPVLVYMRREVVGEVELRNTSLLSLGLTKGKALLRLLFKAPETLKVQANVYDMRVERPDPGPELPHVPMRLQPEPVLLPSPVQPDSQQQAEPGSVGPDQNVGQSLSMEQEENSLMVQPVTAEKPTREASPAVPDSTQPEPVVVDEVVRPVGPHGALVFPAEEAGVGSRVAPLQELGDEFFELSLEEVKGLQSQLRREVARLEEGGVLSTAAMRESEEAGRQLRLLHRYRAGVVRVQFPSRHTVQGEFPAHTTVAELLAWLGPLLGEDGSGGDRTATLYTAPPRTELPSTASLLELDLFPAALVHYSGPATLSPATLAQLSNTAGANAAAARARREAARSQQSGPAEQRGVAGPKTRLPPANPDPAGSARRTGRDQEVSRPGKRSAEPEERGAAQWPAADGLQPVKTPKWFKPGK